MRGGNVTIGPDSDTDLNLRGQVYCQRDNAGESFVTRYDFKGLPKITTLELIDDHTIVTIDWAGSVTLTGEVFTTTIDYDALGRPTATTDPGGNLTENSYDKGGMLLTVTLTPDGGSPSDYVSDIHYDSKGRREAIWYGNGTKTAYTYDPNSYRLIRLLTTQSSTVFQDLNYWYDAVGNITQIKDSAQQTLYFAGSVVNPAQNFTYDSLYRLITAAGREQIGSATFGSNDNNDDAAWISPDHPGNNSIAVQNYTQNYSYDAVGNILSLQHTAGSGSFTRDYNYSSGNSLLNSTDVGATNYPYTYDNRGNMLTMPHLSAMLWNPLNELQKTTRGTTNTYFNYSGGERIRKVAEKSGGILEQRIYLGSYEIYRKFVSGSLTIERTTVHVSDDTGRIAMLEVRTVGSDSAPASLQRYIYSNHLQSASLELDENADIISYEEYHPFGTTAYSASNTAINAIAKRYRYTGKERDEETGLYYHGARYYIPWLARWSASDPINSENYNLQKGYGFEKNLMRHFLELSASPYEYCCANPISGTDPTGEQKVDEVVKEEAVKPKSKVSPEALKELTKDLDQGDRLPSKEVAKEIEKNVEKKVVKEGTKAAEKGIVKALLKGIGKVISKANAVLDIIDLISVPMGGNGYIPPERQMSPMWEEAKLTQIKTELNEAAQRIATGVSTVEEEQKKNGNLIFRTMQTINDGEWIESPPEGADNARQLGARATDIKPVNGMVKKVTLPDGQILGLSASTNFAKMESHLLGLNGNDEYRKKDGAVGMFDKRLLPQGIKAETDNEITKHVSIYPNVPMSMNAYISKLNSIGWIPILTKRK